MPVPKNKRITPEKGLQPWSPLPSRCQSSKHLGVRHFFAVRRSPPSSLLLAAPLSKSARSSQEKMQKK